LARELAGDLDNIVLKAMQHQPERRYASAAALAQDIQNYIERRPVQARPDTLIYRSRQFIRRNIVAVTSVACVALLTTALVGFYTMELAAERYAAERDRQTATRVSMAQSRSTPEISRLNLARALEALGNALHVLNRFDAAERAFDEAWSIRTQLQLDGDTDAIKLLNSIAANQRALQKFAEAPQSHRHAEEYARALSPPSSQLRGELQAMRMAGDGITMAAAPRLQAVSTLRAATSH
jgi:tetratricopeptide (TPR) repeat protein